MFLRSVNELTAMQPVSTPMLFASVQYVGEAYDNAVLLGQCEISTENQNFNQTFYFGMRVRRTGTQPIGASNFIGEYEVPCVVTLPAMLISDLRYGDVIDCLVGNAGAANWFFAEHGFMVMIR
jgi:hypothetical protein